MHIRAFRVFIQASDIFYYMREKEKKYMYIYNEITKFKMLHLAVFDEKAHPLPRQHSLHMHIGNTTDKRSSSVCTGAY